MATSKIKVGDTVRVMTGKSKGHEGKVISVDRKKGRVTVEGANIVTKHQKPSMANQNGGIVQQEVGAEAVDVAAVLRIGQRVTAGDEEDVRVATIQVRRTKHGHEVGVGRHSRLGCLADDNIVERNGVQVNVAAQADLYQIRRASHDACGIVEVQGEGLACE